MRTVQVTHRRMYDNWETSGGNQDAHTDGQVNGQKLQLWLYSRI
jgi:hypothetical protein